MTQKNSSSQPSSDETCGIGIIVDNTFSYDGYQVVRGEFFAHIHEPSFTFNQNKVSLNMACIKKLPNTEYVQILVNPEDKKLAVRPCMEEEKDSFRWCTKNAKKRSPKQITCRVFFAKIINLMGWNPDYRYKLLGKLIRSNDELLFIFDLNNPEIFERISKDGSSSKSAAYPKYPEAWKNQFGVPMEEHQKTLQVNIFDGYAIFDIGRKPQIPKPSVGPDSFKEQKHEQAERK